MFHNIMCPIRVLRKENREAQCGLEREKSKSKELLQFAQRMVDRNELQLEREREASDEVEKVSFLCLI